jgi:hypothetical protein
MQKFRRFLPALEPLETIVAMSGMSGSISALHALIAHNNHIVHLNGQIHGTWSSSFGTPPIPDAGRTQTLNGAGRLRGLGRAELSGTLHTPGFITTGTTTGSLTLTVPHGTIHLVLTGPPQPGFSPPPSSLTYTIDGGTGRFAHATGHGTVSLTEVPSDNGTDAPTFVITFQAAH